MDLKKEKKLWKKGYKRVAGTDEAGRGPLAASVVAAAVVIKNPKAKAGISTLIEEVKDSKKLTVKKRERLYRALIENSNIEWGRGRVSEKVIDKINILEATKLAMKRAVKDLNKKLNQEVDFLVLDGRIKINSPLPQDSIKKADNKVFSCAAASIIAKITRDRMMVRYHKKYPEYGFNHHKGYATKLHRQMLKKYGPCKIHRKSFSPIKKA